MTSKLHTDAVIAGLAQRQHGRVARRQLLAAGVPVHAIDTRVRNGRLIPLGRRVYAVGHTAPSRRADLSTAALQYGSLAFGSAAELLGIEDRRRGPVHVVAAPGRNPKPRRGVVVHRTRSLLRREVGVVDGIQCTLAARTLADVSTVRSRRLLQLAVNRADQRGLLDEAAVIASCRGGVRGHDLLRRILRDGEEVAGVTAALFLDILDEFGLPMPELEVPYRRWRLDAFYREHGVAIELNDYGSHSRRDRFERDHDLAASLRGDRITFHPFSYNQLTTKRRLVAATVADLLGVSISRADAT